MLFSVASGDMIPVTKMLLDAGVPLNIQVLLEIIQANFWLKNMYLL